MSIDIETCCFCLNINWRSLISIVLRFSHGFNYSRFYFVDKMSTEENLENPIYLDTEFVV